ncbi:MAG TPA: CHAP domain-containing protein [Arachnia sp.]|nr:CHAP domain-containing protein [Arachnia sp.]HMT87357.1 CHAP domain-containing protein [Arachnia sp.]
MSAVLATAVALGTMWVAQPASASSSSTTCVGFASCNKAGKGNAGYEGVYRKSFWGMNGGHNCTNYVAYRLQKRGVAKFTAPGRGSALHWGPQAKAKGIAVNKAVPKPGDVAWWAPASSRFRNGHVAYVESVNAAAGTFVVSEDNWGGNFDWRTYRISEVSGFLKLGAQPAAPAPAPQAASAAAVAMVAAPKPVAAKAAAAPKAAAKPQAMSGAPTPKWVGSVRVGKTLTARPGTWKPAQVALSYQWLRDGKAISGATAPAYKLAAADKGKRISVKVTGTKAGFATTAKTSRSSIKVR